MPSFSTRKNISKRDVNFFAEFTASSRRIAKMFGYAIIVGVAVVAVAVAVCVGKIIRNSGVKSEIKNIETKINSPEYQQLSNNSKQLAVEYETRTQYYYALTDMRDFVDRQLVAEMELTELLEKNIPDDTIILMYSIVDGTFTIDGYTFNYYRPSEIVNLLNSQASVYSNVEPKVERFFPEESVKAEDLMQQTVQNYYHFTIVGSLVEDKFVTVKRFAPLDSGTIALTGIETYKVSENVKEIEVTELNVGGVRYMPTGILVNGVAVGDSVFENVLTLGVYSVPVVESNVEVEIDYQPVSEETASEDAASAEGGN